MADKDFPVISEIPEIPDLASIPMPPEHIVEGARVAQESLAAMATTGVLKTIERLNQIINQEAIIQMQAVAQAVQKYWVPAVKQIAGIVSKLIDTISSIRIPAISEEEKLQLFDSNVAWGQYGWTYIPSMPIKMFNTKPENIVEANKLAMKYCGDAEMERLFDKLRIWKLNRQDLESAIFCFKNKQYKACALLLCGLLDSKMIRLQKIDPPKRRDVGSGAVKKMKAKYEDSGEKLLIEALYASNLITYLETLFGNGRDFKTEPETLNRNFIGHGMNHRAVRKRDCIQLFLALNNMMSFLDLEK